MGEEGSLSQSVMGELGRRAGELVVLLDLPSWHLLNCMVLPNSHRCRHFALSWPSASQLTGLIDCR